MKVNPKNKANSGRPLVGAVYLSVIGMLIVVSVYYAFFSTNIQFSPSSENGMSYDDARSALVKLGDNGISWYCGDLDSYSDEQGNVYGLNELVELKKIIGNEERLREEFCQ